ncbi:MAG: transketolase family protein [Candidatus Omnitrophica bacterium]|nr:transketolase family protein [Candidatus Omnitrophota bacterium]
MKKKMIATRDGFGEGLLELGRKNKKVVVLSADLTESTRACWFKDKYPGRFISCGVAEQNMISAAAGLALGGKVPFACTFGVFAAGRAWNQLSISVCYMNLNVNIAGTHCGISVGPDGATHQALEEISLMRALPNMTVVVPADALEAKKATVEAAKIPGPVYLRLTRCAVPVISKESDKFEIGRAKVVKRGKDLTIIACGNMVFEALSAARGLKKEDIDVRVINMHTPKPIDKKAVIKAARETGAIVTCEEHTVYGGLGSAVAEIVSQNCPVPLKMIGIDNQFGQSGNNEELMKFYKLTSEDIKLAVKRLLKKK